MYPSIGVVVPTRNRPGLLRGSLPPLERRRAFMELVRDLGAPMAGAIWDEAFARAAMVARRPFPVSVRELAEEAVGMPLVGIHVVTGERATTIALVFGGTRTVRRISSPISDHDDSIRPYGESCTAVADVMPPPGIGAIPNCR